MRDPNLGGTVRFDWGWVKLVPAWHTSTTPKGAVNTPAGLLVNIGGWTIYHLGDTSLFSDLSLVRAQAGTAATQSAGAGGEIDVALMCIGGHYTMDRFDAVEAARLVGARQVIPCHYDTFPPIETDARRSRPTSRAPVTARSSCSSRARPTRSDSTAGTAWRHRAVARRRRSLTATFATLGCSSPCSIYVGGTLPMTGHPET